MMSGEEGALVEEEEVEMVVPWTADPKPVRRLGRFLKPRARSTDEAVGVPPHPPLLRELLHRGLIRHWPPVARLWGWRTSQFNWSVWFQKLRPLYENQWRRAGIHRAIEESTCEIRRDSSLFFGLLECWCPETNTFVLPWSAEVTVTLEDVMIICGLSVLGEPVRTVAPLAGETGAVVEKMIKEHRGFRRHNSRGAVHCDWLSHYMEGGDGGELEHVAFLSLWLSKHVFPASPYGTVGQSVFPIAARLARGRRIALAPAVLACLYRDLGLLKRHGHKDRISPAVAWAPVQILQVWAWERFVSLRPERRPRPLRRGEPRAMRWHRLKTNWDLPTLRPVLESPDEFQWRPYAVNVDGWGRPSFYEEQGRWVTVVSSGDDDDDDDGSGGGGMRSFARCLRACELVGLDCVEHYAPHRVAMQFGLDQDLPAAVPRADATWELAWSTYDRDEAVRLYVPPRLFESDVTQRFFHWQRLREAAEKAKPSLGSESAPRVGGPLAPSRTGKQRSPRTRKLSTIYAESNSQRRGDSELMKTVDGSKTGVLASSTGLSDLDFEGVGEDDVRKEAEEWVFDLIKSQEWEDEALKRERDSEFDRDIATLKAEIAELEATKSKFESMLPQH